MNLHFEPITKESSVQAKGLSLAPGQEGFVESVSQCLEEASSRKDWRPVGIYHGTVLIGFAMYGYFWEYLPLGRVWLDRLFIDTKYQGKGYGRAAVEGLLQRLKQEYHCKKVFLSVYQNNQTAIQLYQSFGFAFNGEKDIHGEDVMVYCFSKNKIK